MDEFAVVVNTTKGEIERFKESVLWADICKELDMWKDEVGRDDKSLAGHVMDSNLNTGAALTLLGYTEGRREVVERFKNILDILLTNLEANRDDSRRDGADRSETSE